MLTLGPLTARCWAEPSPKLTVRVMNDAQLARRTVEEALMIAGGVYRRAGVAVEWLQEEPDDARIGALTIRLARTASEMPFRTAEDSMGVARGMDGARGTVAYVFYDRVREFAEQGHVDAWIVLGCAIAHELGHLLLPLNAHATDGIMRAQWDSKLISRAGGFLSFAPDQARLLRLRIAGRTASAAGRYHE